MTTCHTIPREHVKSTLYVPHQLCLQDVLCDGMTVSAQGLVYNFAEEVFEEEAPAYFKAPKAQDGAADTMDAYLSLITGVVNSKKGADWDNGALQVCCKVYWACAGSTAQCFLLCLVARTCLASRSGVWSDSMSMLTFPEPTACPVPSLQRIICHFSLSDCTSISTALQGFSPLGISGCRDPQTSVALKVHLSHAQS